eukprot:g1292.t1
MSEHTMADSSPGDHGTAASAASAAPGPGSSRRLTRKFSALEKQQLGDLAVKEFNDVQKAAVAEIRAAAAEDLAGVQPFPEVVGDRRILRFLRGHKFVMATAIEYYTNMLKWRKEHGIDEIRTALVEKAMGPDDFPFAAKIGAVVPVIVRYGHDKEGRPIHIFRPGAISVKKLMATITEEEYRAFHIHSMEYTQLHLDALAETTGKLMRQLVILDLKGL